MLKLRLNFRSNESIKQMKEKKRQIFFLLFIYLLNPFDSLEMLMINHQPYANLVWVFASC